MGLNIKNERVHALAREAAAKTGQSQTSAIEEALRRYLDELDASSQAEEEQRWARVEEILADFDAARERGVVIPANTDFLYDENGLPT